MELKILQHEDAIKIFAPIIVNKKLIPVFGAGFSMGAKTKRGSVVMDAKKSTEIMKEIILKNGKISVSTLNGKDFFKTAELFLQDEYVIAKDRQAFFLTYFVDAQMSEIKSRFISDIDWPFAYTLNIDDAIENVGNFTPVMPYKKLNSNSNDTPMHLLYKLHGDAKQEAIYKSDKNVVFSSTQYIQALQEKYNESLLNNTTAVYAGFNIVFIGCSLNNEPDIKLIYEKGKKDRLPNLYTSHEQNVRSIVISMVFSHG